MDLALEANRNSALHNTMQQVLDVYNPLLHKARPTVVNQTKHRIRVQPTRWGNTLSPWNQSQEVRFDLPRIGSLYNFSLKCAFKIPGTPPTGPQLQEKGYRGYAKTGITTGSTTNLVAATNTARGRLDRLYADRFLGFNMIEKYVVNSKSRQIFSASGEYLLVRLSQMDPSMKEAILQATTPVDIMNPDVDDMFYSPGRTYSVAIPLFMFFNEHITSALDVNFSEEVNITITLRPPSRLFYYGQLGDLSQLNVLAVALTAAGSDIQGYSGAGTTTHAGKVTWDQAVHDTANGTLDLLGMVEFPHTLDSVIPIMQQWGAQHIRGLQAPLVTPGAAYGELGTRYSGPTFAFPDVDALGESISCMFEGSADYIIQDTDAYRALRAQQFPEGTGLTTITYDTSQETFAGVFSAAPSAGAANTLLDVRMGGPFTDPGLSQSGITIGNSSFYIDLQLKTNNLVFATHFMVRKMSDMGGDNNQIAGNLLPLLAPTHTSNVLGAHRIYSRCLPVHYFQLLSAGRVLYESDGSTHLNLTQSGFYNGTGLGFDIASTDGEDRMYHAFDKTRTSGRPFNVYSINFGLSPSRLENSGALSYQNLNNPILRIYFKPETWSEYNPYIISGATPAVSNAVAAASLGVRVDVIHEYFNVVTINSGNGEITSGLNQ